MTTTQRAQHARQASGNHAFTWSLWGLVLLAGVLRFIKLGSWPGLEWDENVYRTIGEHVAQNGQIVGKTEYLTSPELYLYHPPFHFEVLGAWFKVFGSSLVSARALAVVASLIMLVLLGYFLRRMIGNWALLAVGLLAVDTWMVFSNRVSWIENIMLPIGIAGLWLYDKAFRRSASVAPYATAGVVLGFAAIYKHLGALFLVAVGIHWLVTRKQHRRHLVLFAASLATLVLYVLGMLLIFGKVYFTESSVQLARTLGLRESRGALTTWSEVFGPLLGQYIIFVGTVFLVLVGVGVLVFRTLQAILKRNTRQIESKLLFAWAWASLGFIMALQLRQGHYLMLLVIPLFCYLVAEIRVFVQNHQQRRPRSKMARNLLFAGLMLVMALNLNAFSQRFIDRPDNALAATADWMDANAPADAKVMTEESVGYTIQQPYCKIWRAAGCVGSEYIITYESHTQQIPDNPALRRLIASGIVVFKTSGYKETITVIRLPQPIGG